MVFIGGVDGGKILSEKDARLLSERKTLHAWPNFLRVLVWRRTVPILLSGGGGPSVKQTIEALLHPTRPHAEGRSTNAFLAYIYLVLADKRLYATVQVRGIDYSTCIYGIPLESLQATEADKIPSCFWRDFFLLGFYPFLIFLCHVYVPKRGSSASICCIVTYLSVFLTKVYGGQSGVS